MVEITKPNFNNGLWASGGAIVAPSNTKIATGWTAEVPPFQWENYAQNRQDQGIAHILQHGISVWDNLTEYQAGKSYVQGSDGLLYLARTTNTGVNPVTDSSFVNWTKAFSGGLLNVQVFSSAGAFTYTPTPGTGYIIADIQGGGGQGGGSPTGAAGNVSLGSGGHSGAYALIRLNMTGIATIAGQVGAGGGSAGAGAVGQTGGTSSLGPYATCPGGAGGGIYGPTSVGVFANGSGLPLASVSAPAVTIKSGGGNGGAAGFVLSATAALSGSGGPSQGYGGNLAAVNITSQGPAAQQVGSGGGGGLTLGAGAAQVGGVGGVGRVVIYEYLK